MSYNHANISKADAAAYSSSDDDASDDDGLTRPSVDPRDDEFADYNPRKRRKTGRNTKESAALGIFGSDSEDDRPKTRRRPKKDLRHQNVAFVSAGQQKLDQKDDEDEDEDEEDADEAGRPGLGAQQNNTASRNRNDEEDEDEEDGEDEDMAGMGLGFRPSTGGLGWTPAAFKQTASSTPNDTNTPNKQSSTMNTTYDGSNPLGKSFIPTSAREPVLKPNLPDNEPSSAPQTPKASAFSKSGGSKSKSFAARMMAKMGYVEGQGLGAGGQGRASIVEATLRPSGNVGLGTVREKNQQEIKEEKRQARLRGEEVSDSDEEKKKAKRERKKKAGESGSGSGVSTPRRSKPKYMTVNDIQKAAPGLHIPEAFAPILDMTGRDSKLLTAGSGLLTPTAGGTELVEQTEARKLARRAQGELAAYVEEWKTLEERRAWLDMEAIQRQQEIDELQGEFSSLQVFSAVLDEVCQAAREQQWDPIISGLKKADVSASTYNEELSSIAVASIHPFLSQATQGWQPLEDPNLGNFTADLLGIQKLLGLQESAARGGAVTKWNQSGLESDYHHVRSTTPYESMIYKLVVPKLATTISQAWDVYDAAPLLAILDRWDPLFPAFVRSQLLEQVVRRLGEAIASWKPRKSKEKGKSLPPHLWLFPWLQHLPPHHLDPKGSGLVADVRRKYRQVIDTWQFDRGVVPGLKAWQDIFRPSSSGAKGGEKEKDTDQWRPLVMHHVLPSMGRYLRLNFRVDPGDQEPYLKMLQGVLKWTDVLSTSMVVEVVVAEVFPLWHDVLYQWLVSDSANYEEIGAWFEWWHDEVFPEGVRGHKSVVAEFERGTRMIERALELGDEVGSRLARPERGGVGREKRDGDREHRKRREEKEREKERGREREKREKDQVSEQPAAATFRDEVEAWALDNDLRFMPVRKANETGKHYFRLTARLDGKGGVLAYFRTTTATSGNGEENMEVLVVESRKINGAFGRRKPEEWDALLAGLLEEVEGR
ncbi:GC-rich sequence DNA-binding factor-like protein-domain-containing protein [Astrocystis sublimbata]|nr:GC-rich sequence DNA-binding factor-like protein-domain-containing protein [Astrocystis sublimbata]